MRADGDREPPEAPAAIPSRRRALVLFALSSVCFGLMAFVAKLATATLGGGQVALLRFGMMLVPFAVAPSLARRAMRYERLDLLFYRGFFGGTAVLLYFLAIAHLPVAIATLLNYSSPIFSVLFARAFLGEPMPVRKVVPLVAALAGLALVMGERVGPGEWSRSGRWTAVGLLSAVLSGAAVTAIRAARRTESSWAVYGSFSLLGLVATAPVGIWEWRTPSAVAVGWIVLVGASSIAAQLLMTYAFRWVDNLQAGVFAPLAPLIAAALGVVLLGERLTPVELAGGALALGGVAATVVAGHGATAPESE
ncbi:MAG: DMT family transporter [Holophagales bacterium]|nr:MAG: DMT family transporter [Holophagales bacterium]